MHKTNRWRDGVLTPLACGWLTASENTFTGLRKRRGRRERVYTEKLSNGEEYDGNKWARSAGHDDRHFLISHERSVVGAAPEHVGPGLREADLHVHFPVVRQVRS
jgi:hypothetical protein